MVLCSMSQSLVFDRNTKSPEDFKSHPPFHTRLFCLRCLRSGPARKRPRPLEEAVKAGDGVALKFSESFAVDNQNLVLLQVRFVLSLAAG